MGRGGWASGQRHMDGGGCQKQGGWRCVDRHGEMGKGQTRVRCNAGVVLYLKLDSLLIRIHNNKINPKKYMTS